MSSKFECHYRQIFGGGLGQLSKYPLLEAVGIQMSSKFECHYCQIFCGWWHTTAKRGNLTQRLRCFALRIKMLRCRRPLRDFSSCYFLGASFYWRPLRSQKQRTLDWGWRSRVLMLDKWNSRRFSIFAILEVYIFKVYVVSLCKRNVLAQHNSTNYSFI